jgi:flagella basal body P-ring formation protein FlgA
MMTNRQHICNTLIFALALLGISSIIFLTPSIADAASWNPGKELRAYLMNNYPWEEIEVSNLQVIGKLSDEPPYRIIVEKGPLGRAAFSFIDRNNKKNIIRANVRAFGWVVKSKRPFHKGHIIEHDDLYLSRADVKKMRRGSVNDLAEIVGKSLKRSITANIPIVEGMIEMSQTVARGQRVVLLLSHNGMSITASGETREKGYVGMPVKVMNLSSKKEISGMLIDEKTVKVEL